MNPAVTLNQMKLSGRRGKSGGRRRMTEQVKPGPDVGRPAPSRLAGLPFEAEVYRLPFEFPQGGELVEPRPEGLPLRPFSGES
jgi:hypothetical protein